MSATDTLTRSLSEAIDSVESTLADTYDTTTRVLTERAEQLNHELTDRIDQVEERIPELPKKVFAYNRAVASRATAQARRNNELVIDAFRPVVRVADTGVRTVVGTAKWAVEQTAGTAATGIRSVVGQAKAQAKRTATTLNTQTTDLVDEATDRVVAAEQRLERSALRKLTKAELYQMAQDIDIDGRADMTKAQLVDAISNAG